MPKILQFQNKDKQGKVRNTGYMEIKNQTETSAELYLYGDIISYSMSENYRNYYPDDKCPKDIKDFLDEIGEVSHLDIHINSGGGSVFGGIAIYNLLKNYKATKTVYIDGIAASIASVIACAGDKIVMPKNATFMIHKPMNGYFWATMNADELRKDAETLDNCQKAIVNTYMSKVKDGITRETIENMVNVETWLIGDEAEQYFDFEIEESTEAVACSSDYFDKYENTPENLKSPEELKATININADEIVEKLYAKLKADTNPKDESQEQIKNQLLEDLDYL
ncbi:Clp protease ClpP [Anaerocolumna aminovalerica]|uniref:head maturation protease, ClpP-related n=1 Tax=Anaerocolumna aminovalerica TaxID=1527 RepID=UPI001C0E91DA|nr:Clp protease ClpP [Anaerocolumna aminovalerica]